MMRQTLQPSLIAGGSGRTILIAGGERGVIYDGRRYGLSWDVLRKAKQYGVWKEVRRWAKAHPLAVKFVNQDTDMIHSIAQTGWTRWIDNGDRAYFTTNISPSQYEDIYGEITWRRNAQYGSWDTLFGAQENNSGYRNAMFWLNGNNLHARWGSVEGVNITTGVASGTGVHTIKASVATGIIFDGKKVSQPTSAPWCTKPMAIFKGSNTTSEAIKAALTEVKIGKSMNEIDHHFLPYRSPDTGQMELLDIVTGTLATRVGTFTESIEKNQ